MDIAVLNFYLDLVLPFYFLKWNRFFSPCKRKFVKFFISFFKGQVSFRLNFASNFSAFKHNSCVLFYLKHYILWSKAALQSANFWDFWVFGSKFVKFLMSVLNWQVNSTSIFRLFFTDMTNNFPVNFKLTHFQLLTKEFHQNPNFETFKCSGENCPNLHVIFGGTSQFPFKFCTNLDCHQT